MSILGTTKRAETTDFSTFDGRRQTDAPLQNFGEGTTHPSRNHLPTPVGTMPYFKITHVQTVPEVQPVKVVETVAPPAAPATPPQSQAVV